jgi:hypothetical protein
VKKGNIGGIIQKEILEESSRKNDKRETVWAKSFTKVGFSQLSRINDKFILWITFSGFFFGDLPLPENVQPT